MFTASRFQVRHVALGLTFASLVACGSADEGDGASSSAESAYAAPGKCFVTAKDGLNIRAQPSTDGDVIMTLKCGDQVTVHATQWKSGEQWADLGPVMGAANIEDWVSGRWLDCTGRRPTCPGDAPPASSPPAASPPSTGAVGSPALPAGAVVILTTHHGASFDEHLWIGRASIGNFTVGAVWSATDSRGTRVGAGTCPQGTWAYDYAGDYHCSGSSASGATATTVTYYATGNGALAQASVR